MNTRTLAAVLLVVALTGCGTEEREAQKNAWVSQAETLAAALSVDRTSYQTIGPDPKRYPTPRRVSGVTRVKSTTAVVQNRLAAAADSVGVEVKCGNVSFEKAANLMGEDGVHPVPPKDVESMVCNVYTDDSFGFAVLTGLSETVTATWHSFGPDSAPQLVL